MGVNGIELAVGQVWVTRGGERVEIVHCHKTDDPWPWVGQVQSPGAGTYSFDPYGFRFATDNPTPSDLVRLEVIDNHQASDSAYDGLNLFPLSAGDPDEGVTFAALDVFDDRWITWCGIKCPVSAETQVEVRFHDGNLKTDRAHTFDWNCDGDGEIVAYRVVGGVNKPVSEDGWVDWFGGECPVPAAARCEVRFRSSSSTSTSIAGTLRWKLNGLGGDIVAYRVIGGLPTRTSEFKSIFDAQAAWTRPAEPGLTLNPKDAIGATKLPLHLWPAEASALGCLGMLEGMLKYGRNNYIAGEGVIASIYIDAACRHLLAWFAGEEDAHDTGTPHLANALATIAIVVKTRAHGKLIDDRDYATLPNGARYRAFVEELTPHVGRLKELFADKHPQHFTIADVKPAVDRKRPDDTEGGEA